jgi:putative hydrolase of the HAD superfamily
LTTNHLVTKRGETSLNVVFDLGGVVFKWQPDEIIRSVFADSETQELARAGIIEHNDWVELDRGSITLDQAIDRAAARTDLPRLDIEQLFHTVPQHLTPIEETIELIRTVRESNNRLYVLSNMHLESITYLEKEHRIWDLFDGAVISCRVRMVKPELDIYEHLLNAYQLNAAETIFIDDLVENLEAASSMGIQTLRFVDPSQCRRALLDLNFI